MCDATASANGDGVCPQCVKPAALADLSSGQLDEILPGADDFEKACYAVDMNLGLANLAGARCDLDRVWSGPRLMEWWTFENFRGPYLEESGVTAGEFGQRLLTAPNLDFREFKTGWLRHVTACPIYRRADDRIPVASFWLGIDGTIYRHIGMKNDTHMIEPVAPGAYLEIPSGTSIMFNNY